MRAPFAICFLLIALVLVAFSIAGDVAPPATVLHVQTIQLTNAAMFSWVADNSDPAGTGSGQIVSNSYSGQAFVISADALTGPMLVECSEDLINWRPFPQSGFQVTLMPTNLTATDRKSVV